MKIVGKLSVTVATLLVVFTTSAFTFFNMSWKITDDYHIKFSGKDIVGTLKGLTGTIKFSPSALQDAKIDVSVAANTLNTGNETKDKHARGESWFDVEKYPKISFQSSSFTKQGDKYVVVGMLTLHGITKQVSIPFQFNETSTGGTFVGNFSVNRKDFGIDGNMFGFMVAKDFAIELKVPVSKTE